MIQRCFFSGHLSPNLQHRRLHHQPHRGLPQHRRAKLLRQQRHNLRWWGSCLQRKCTSNGKSAADCLSQKRNGEMLHFSVFVLDFLAGEITIDITLDQGQWSDVQSMSPPQCHAAWTKNEVLWGSGTLVAASWAKAWPAKKKKKRKDGLWPTMFHRPPERYLKDLETKVM